MEKKTIGAFIAALRKANGLTQKQLAEKLNVSDKAVSRWERDECAPDLSLIPVIAEIFGITSDELLRGQKNNPDIPIPESAPDKTEKQLKRLLAVTKTKFKIQSIISVAIAAAGLIAAMICNFAFNRAHLGFLLGCVFYVAAVVCQIIFTILAHSRIDAEEFATEIIHDFKKSVAHHTQFTLSCILTVLTATAPLAIYVPSAYWGLTAPSWAVYLLLYIPIPAALCALTCWIINLRLGYTVLRPRSKLRLITAGILLLVLALTLTLHYFTDELLYANMHLYAPHQRFDSFDAFKEHIETPLDPDGNEMKLIESHDHGRIYESLDGDHFFASFYYLGGPDGPDLYRGYCRANMTIQHIEPHGDSHCTFTAAQYAQAQDNFIIINLCILPIYIAEIIAAIVLYRRRATQLA